jgi:diacylglycerol kinase (ATP)
MKPFGWLESVNCAIEGILWAARTQRHLRYHFLAAVLVLLTALFLRVSTLEFTLLALAVILVLFAELFNTALEVLVDLVSPEYHPLARRAKDVAAGAVLVTSVGAVVIGYLGLSRYIFPLFEIFIGDFNPPPGEHSVVALLTVVILVVLLKARLGRGTPLHGGMPSGHAAVAFSIATSISAAKVGLLLSVLAYVTATMVSHSRLLLRIHTFREVLAGALLGTVVTLLVHLVFPG